MTIELPTPRLVSGAAIDSGRVTSPAAVGTNFLQDSSKRWAPGVHRNRLVRIAGGAGAGQMAVVGGNSDQGLVIKQAWAIALDTTSTYEILDVDLAFEFSELRAALERTLEAATDTGTATGGSQTTIVDAGKNWEADMWRNAIAEVIIGGISYQRLVSGNTADTVTIAALPPGVSVSAGDSYMLKQATRVADILRWGGTALTGRDISLDLANLDLALTALRDALRGAGTKDFSTLEADAESILAQLQEMAPFNPLYLPLSETATAGSTTTVDHFPAEDRVWYMSKVYITTTTNTTAKLKIKCDDAGVLTDVEATVPKATTALEIDLKAEYGMPLRVVQLTMEYVNEGASDEDQTLIIKGAEVIERW